MTFQRCELDLPDGRTSEDSDNVVHDKHPDSTSTETESSSYGFFFPPDAHIVPNRDRDDSVLIPCFVVAERTNIKLLIYAALHQRFVLSIDEPLIGIELTDNSPIVRVHLNWIELQDDIVSVSSSR